MGFYVKRRTIANIYAEFPNAFLVFQREIPTRINSGTLLQMLLAECGELQTPYAPVDEPVSSNSQFVIYLNAWSMARHDTWVRMLAALEATYNPINNYDRTDSETEYTAGTASNSNSRTGSEDRQTSDNTVNNAIRANSENEDSSTSNSGSDVSSRSGLNSETGTDSANSAFTGHTATSGGDSTAHNKQGFNSTQYQADTQDVTTLGSINDSNSNTATGTIRASNSSSDEAESLTSSRSGSGSAGRGATGTDSATINRTASDSADRSEDDSGISSDSHSRSRTLRSSGNIGVTTSQQMIDAEISLREKYNMYDIIIGEFKRQFCVEVW